MQRFPIGPISAISPFNFPLNLLCHKVGMNFLSLICRLLAMAHSFTSSAPAIAVGSTVVAKPPPQCPQLAYSLAEILTEAGLPHGAYNVMHMDIPLAEVSRIRILIRL